MIKIENTKVEGWEPAIRGMRNPMNSWGKSDSEFFDGDEFHDICGNSGHCAEHEEGFDIGWADRSLMLTLAKAGKDHAKYRRMIVVYADLTAPLYWWKEYDTYKVGTVANSCSTMHKIQAKEFTLDDFSHEYLFIDNSVIVEAEGLRGDFRVINNTQWLMFTCDLLNAMRESYLKTNDKRYWWQMIQLLPSSYNQRRTVMLNYEVLANIYHARKNHKLDEWHTFCDWIENLPESWIITGEDI